MPWRRAVDEDRIMHAYGRRNQLILFDDVDINTQIEVVAGQHMGRRGCAESAEGAGDRAGIRPDDLQNPGRARKT